MASGKWEVGQKRGFPFLKYPTQEEFTLPPLLPLLPRFGDTFVRRKDNLLPPIILEVEVELLKGERERKEAVTFRPYSWQKGEKYRGRERERERDVL